METLRLSSPVASAPKAPAGTGGPLVPSRGRDRGFTNGDGPLRSYLQAINRVKPLAADVELELAARVRKGEKQAREQLIQAHLRTVVNIAREYEGAGLPLLNLISEGNLGLVEAVHRFDPAKRRNLSIHTSRWIKRSIERALARAKRS